MLANCESHHIHKLRPWFRRIVEAASADRSLVQAIFDRMGVIFRRLADEFVEDRCFDLILVFLTADDRQFRVRLYFKNSKTHVFSLLQLSALRALPQVAEYMPLWFINKKVLVDNQQIYNLIYSRLVKSRICK